MDSNEFNKKYHYDSEVIKKWDGITDEHRLDTSAISKESRIDVYDIEYISSCILLC